jgi:hypothetical protein
MARAETLHTVCFELDVPRNGAKSDGFQKALHDSEVPEDKRPVAVSSSDGGERARTASKMQATVQLHAIALG